MKFRRVQGYATKKGKRAALGMRALDAVRSTELELGAVKLSTMIRDIIVICPMVCIETYLCTLPHKAHEFHV